MPLDMAVSDFLGKFGAPQMESCFFYDKTIELRFDRVDHIYYLVGPNNGELIAQDGVTTVLQIIDKSIALIPWACKMMAEKLLLKTVPVSTDVTGTKYVYMTYDEFEKTVTAAKTAHKEKLEAAGKIGTMAHDWIEQYIKAEIAGTLVNSYYPSEERAANCCGAALKWMKEHHVRWISTETKIYSKKHGYAGTMDGLCYIDSCGNPLCCPVPFRDRFSLIDWKSSNALHIEYIIQTAAYQQAYEEEHEKLIDDRWVIRLGKDDGKFETWHFERPDYFVDWLAFSQALSLKRSTESLTERVRMRQSGIRDAKRAIKVEIKAALARKKEEDKEMARKDRLANLAIKCANADKYKGTRKPNCNKGVPCLTCLDKYESMHPVVVATIGQWADFRDTGFIPIPEGTPLDDILAGLHSLLQSGYNRSGFNPTVETTPVPNGAMQTITWEQL
jgi:hypothetical protein